MNYLADPGGRFPSDVHRRVLGHLPTPQDQYGWTVPALHNRMVPDVGTDLQSPDEVAGILDELAKDGHAEKLTVNMANGDSREVWRMTQDGFDLLTGPIANEPPPGAEVQGPAMIGGTGETGATRLDGALDPLPPADPDEPEAAADEGGAADAANSPAR